MDLTETAKTVDFCQGEDENSLFAMIGAASIQWLLVSFEGPMILHSNTSTRRSATPADLPIAPSKNGTTKSLSEVETAEDLFEPLVYTWNKSTYVASQAVHAFCADFHADH